MPASVSNVFGNAFKGCRTLKKIHFLNPHVLKLSGNAFDNLPSPLNIVYAGSSEDWLKSIASYTEESHSYDNGWGGGAPGVYTYVTYYYPMGHSLGADFSCSILCEGDKRTITANGEKRSSNSRLVSSPYDD